MLRASVADSILNRERCARSDCILGLCEYCYHDRRTIQRLFLLRVFKIRQAPILTPALSAILLNLIPGAVQEPAASNEQLLKRRADFVIVNVLSVPKKTGR